MRIGQPIFGHINTTFLLFKSNFEISRGSDWTVFHLDGLERNCKLDQKRGINYNYESVLIIDSFVTSQHPKHGNETKLKMV